MNIDPTKVGTKVITLRTATELLIPNFYMTLDAAIAGRSYQPHNMLIYGPNGCGKTEGTRAALKRLLGVNDLRGRIVDFEYLGKKHRIGVDELHGATIDVTNISIPCKTEVSPGVFILTHLLNDFFGRVAPTCDMLVLLIQDINKNADVSFNNMLKSFLDCMIGNQKLPPVFIVMTANPYGVKYVNNKIDNTVRSTCTVLNCTYNHDDAVKFITESLPETREFFDSNRELIYVESNAPDEGEATVRSWTTAMNLVAYERTHNGCGDNLPYALKGLVGEKQATEFCLWWKKKNFQDPNAIDWDTPAKKLAKIVEGRADLNYEEAAKQLEQWEYADTATFLNALGESKSKSIMVSLFECDEYVKCLERDRFDKDGKISSAVESILAIRANSLGDMIK